MTHTKFFIYNLLNLVKISRRRFFQPPPSKGLTIIKPLVKESDPRLFNKRRPKIDYP